MCIISNDALYCHFKAEYKGKVRAKIYDKLFLTYRKQWKKWLSSFEYEQFKTNVEPILESFDGYFLSVFIKTGRK